MRPVDLIPGFAPKREAIKTTAGWRITVTPGAFSQLPPNSLDLTNEQYERYQRWLGGELIQNVLFDLTKAEREILMTGIGDADFHRITVDPEDDPYPPEVPCIDGTGDHEWVVSDEDENYCYCSRCGCGEY